MARENTDLTKNMRAKIESCVKWMNPHLLGPNNKKIEIELIDPAQGDSKQYREIANWITVSEEKIERENSGHYSLRTSCPVIAHELLHLLGLVDEYKEPMNIRSYEQDCRSIGPPDSIMSNHEEGTDQDHENLPEKMFLACCICKDNSCERKSKSEISSMKSCPAGYDLVKSYTKTTKDGQSDPQMFCNSFSGTGGMKMGFGSAGQKEAFLLSARPSRRIEGSFLYPAQFRVIVAPGCKEKNHLYYSCSRDSYYRPYKFIGSCNSKPVECQNEDDWLQ